MHVLGAVLHNSPDRIRAYSPAFLDFYRCQARIIHQLLEVALEGGPVLSLLATVFLLVTASSWHHSSVRCIKDTVADSRRVASRDGSFMKAGSRADLYKF